LNSGISVAHAQSATDILNKAKSTPAPSGCTADDPNSQACIKIRDAKAAKDKADADAKAKSEADAKAKTNADMHAADTNNNINSKSVTDTKAQADLDVTIIKAAAYEQIIRAKAEADEEIAKIKQTVEIEKTKVTLAKAEAEDQLTRIKQEVEAEKTRAAKAKAEADEEIAKTKQTVEIDKEDTSKPKADVQTNLTASAVNKPTYNNIYEEREALLQADFEADQKTLSDYFSKNLSLSEQVLNYTSTGNETGRFGQRKNEGSEYWSSQGKCKFTHYSYSLDEEKTKKIGVKDLFDPSIVTLGKKLYSIHKVEQVDFDEINWKSAILKPRIEKNIYEKYETHYDFIAEKIKILGAPDTVLERLQKGWSLVQQECPGKKSAF